jgi:Delta14-sterol reductase
MLDLEFIKTEKGSKLLVAGWWGRARHINYFGDWIMAWSWCLPTGFSTPVPYIYVAYFAVRPLAGDREADPIGIVDSSGEKG